MVTDGNDNGTIDVADVTGSEVTDALLGLDLSIAGLDTDPDLDRETARGQLLGNWPVFGRPKSGAQAWVARRGDEVLVLAVGDARWLVSIEEGDAVITAAVENGPKVWLKADGTTHVVGDPVKIGTGLSPAEWAAIASLVDNRLATIRTAYNAHKHTETGGTTNVPDTLIAALASVASSKVAIE